MRILYFVANSFASMNSKTVSAVNNVSPTLLRNSTASFAGSKAACNEANDSKSNLLITSRAFSKCLE